VKRGRPLGLGLTLAVSVVAAAGGCAKAEPQTIVFAAASLSAPFAVLATEFEKLHPGSKVVTNFAGTQQLVQQIREGAAIGVFAAADVASMAKVVACGTTLGEPQVFAKNRLAIVVANDNPKRIAALPDLAKADLRVALCAPEVPAGAYARQALDLAGVTVQSLSDEPSVQALVGKVRLGELDAGIAYATDCRGAGVAEVRIPDAHQTPIVYPIVALAGSKGGDGTSFVQFVMSPAGQRVLADFGFLPP
jgi:molybdate transport system substrate-binding protein